MFSPSWLEVNRCRTRLRRAGNGTPIVYLHGANGVPNVPGFLDKFVQNWDVLVPEHPGFGESGDPEWLECMDDLTYYYLDWLDQLGLDRLHVIGSSLGGWLAMELAIRQPLRFQSLTLIGSAGLAPPAAGLEHLFRWNPEQMARHTFHGEQWVQGALAAQQDPDIDAKNRHTITRLAWQPRLHHPMLYKRLHRLKMPVLLTWGEQDRILPVTQLAEFKRHLPHADVRTYPDCGHLPQVEQQAAFAHDALCFLRSVPA